MEAILQQKAWKVTGQHELKGCNRKLEMRISKTKAGICQLVKHVSESSIRQGLRDFKNVYGVDALREALGKLSELNAKTEPGEDLPI